MALNRNPTVAPRSAALAGPPQIAGAAALRARGDHGFTLVEVLIATTLALVLLGSASTLLVQSLHAQNHTFNRVDTTETLQAALATMVNELRPAASVAYITGKGNLGIAVTAPATVIPAGGTTAGSAVNYDCFTTSGTCNRTIAGAVKQQLATNITNADLFTLMCRSTTGTLLTVTNGGSTAGCANAGALDYVAIKLVASVGCAGQGVPAVSCNNGNVEVDGGTALRSQP